MSLSCLLRHHQKKALPIVVRLYFTVSKPQPNNFARVNMFDPKSQTNSTATVFGLDNTEKQMPLCVYIRLHRLTP